MDSVDGQVFIKAGRFFFISAHIHARSNSGVAQNLAHFVQKHETALANALHLQRQGKKHGDRPATAGASQSAESLPLHQALTRSYLPLSRSIKPAKLTLTPHHLYFLLSKFEETLAVDIGPLNVRLENLQHDAPPANYVSFLGHAPKSKGRQTDADSLRSVSSMRSVVSSMSQLWSTLTLSGTSTAKQERQMNEHKANIRYLYSCFTKIPALKLSPDRQARLVEGYEEFPFETSVPLLAFKNVSALEICELDFRQFYGWDRLADQLRSLILRRAHVDDPIDLLHHIVLDDVEGRRKRSFKTNLPTTPSTPGMPWPSSSPRVRHMELQRTWSAPNSPMADQRRGSTGSPAILSMAGSQDSGKKVHVQHSRQRSDSPARTLNSRHGSLTKRPQQSGSVRRRKNSGGSSDSSTNENMTPRRSTTDLSASLLPWSKWQFLRHLGLAENGLTYLNAASFVPVAQTLQSLDLSGNLFTEVPDALASLTHLRALNLSNCMIDSLQSLTRSPLPAITTLNLRSNRLANLSGIERLLSLERVDLRDNRLRDPTELARLTGIPDIVDLYVIKNPFTRTHPNYRVTIFNLFRSTPGHQQDVSIDAQGPQSFEKSQLVDRVAEPPSKPVIPVPAEDEEEIHPTGAGAPTAAELQEIAPQYYQSAVKRHGHRRTTSDFGPQPSQRKKRAPPSRLIHLTEPEPTADATSPTAPSPARPAQQRHQPLPDLGLSRTPTENDTPITPGPTPYHTAPTTQAPYTTATSPAPPPSRRPALDTAFASPTPGAPRIRDPSSDDDDDDDSPVRSPQDLGHSELYKQKIEALKGELGPGWLSALGGGGGVEGPRGDGDGAGRERERERERTGAVRVVEGGRTLGRKS